VTAFFRHRQLAAKTALHPETMISTSVGSTTTGAGVGAGVSLCSDGNVTKESSEP